jgi:hypothetical protein
MGWSDEDVNLICFYCGGVYLALVSILEMIEIEMQAVNEPILFLAAVVV